MKFIRKNGRIIPIGNKNEVLDAKQAEKKLTKKDVLVGAATGAVAGMFFKRRGVRETLGLMSWGSGLGTTIDRVNVHGATTKALWEDGKASLMKNATTLFAFGAASLGTIKLNQVLKARKAFGSKL